MLQLSRMISCASFALFPQLVVDDVLQQQQDCNFYDFEPDSAETTVCGIEPCDSCGDGAQKEEAQVMICKLCAEFIQPSFVKVG